MSTPDRLTGPLAARRRPLRRSRRQSATRRRRARPARRRAGDRRGGLEEAAGQPGTGEALCSTSTTIGLARLPEIDVKAPGLDGRFAVAARRRPRAASTASTSAASSSATTTSRHRQPPAERRLARRYPRRAARCPAAVQGRDEATRARRRLAAAGDQRADRSPGARAASRAAARHRRAAAHRRRLADRPDRRPFRQRPQTVAARLSATVTARAGCLQSDDLGATLKLFGIADNVVGGRLTVDGQLCEADGQRTLRAHIEGSDYRWRARRSWRSCWRCRR